MGGGAFCSKSSKFLGFRSTLSQCWWRGSGGSSSSKSSGPAGCWFESCKKSFPNFSLVSFSWNSVDVLIGNGTKYGFSRLAWVTKFLPVFFQLNIVVMFKSNNLVWPTPIWCKFCVFVKKTFHIKQDQLTNNEIVRHCFLVRILFCFLANNCCDLPCHVQQEVDEWAHWSWLPIKFSSHVWGW